MTLLPFVLILVQLVCYLKKKKSFIVFLGFVTCVLGNRFLIILIMSLFSFPPSSTSWCHVLWVVNLSNEEMGLVEPDPAVGQLAFSGPFLWEGSRTGFGAAAVGSNRVLGLWQLMGDAARLLVGQSKGLRGVSVSPTWVSSLLRVALVPSLASVCRACSRLWGVAGALELWNACLVFAAENRNGGTGLKAALVLPGKWCAVFFQENSFSQARGKSSWGSCAALKCSC